MKLSCVLTDYRDRLQISQRELARRCGLSNSYISFIENEFNPRTGKPIVPTLEQYQKIAYGMNMSVQELFEKLDDDSPVQLPSHDDVYSPSTTEARILSKGVDRLPPEERKRLLEMASLMFEHVFDKEEGDET